MSTNIESAVDDMLLNLAERLEDESANEFSADIKLDALNEAQAVLVNMLHDEYLTELEVSEEWTAGVDQPKFQKGRYNIGSLSNTVLGGSSGIRHVRNTANAKYLSRISPSEVKMFDSAMVSTDLDDPYYMVFGNEILLVPTTSQVTMPIDILYLKHPTKLAVSGGCDLNSALHHLIIGLAEGYCWRMVEDTTRQNNIEGSVANEITILNAKYSGGTENV